MGIQNVLKQLNMTETAYYEVDYAELIEVAPGSHIDLGKKPAWVDANHNAVLDLVASVQADTADEIQSAAEDRPVEVHVRIVALMPIEYWDSG